MSVKTSFLYFVIKDLTFARISREANLMKKLLALIVTFLAAKGLNHSG